MARMWKVAAVASALLTAAGTELSAQVCVGNCDVLGADGVVTAPPVGTTYRYVSTNGGTLMGGLTGIGGTNGSTYRTSLFAAEGGDLLEFYFNYVTSDGSSFADYAWVRLLNSDMSEAALLFTARTTPGGNTVPGFGMPTLNATLEPASTPIIPGGPAWAPLGGWSGACFNTGCGYTGWIRSMFTIASGGNYMLEFGATNYLDNLFDSGLAWAGTQVAGTPIEPDSTVPEPITLVLVGTGLVGIGAARRRRKNEVA